MAKKKGNRLLIGLECTETGMRSYITQKNRINTTDKVELMKYNKKLKKHTLHKEVLRLK
ncbi:50S ribosomal protein L33 [candidate division WWE3 bacterium RIFOXYC2_FULL_42_13]|uniref:Large ribosomal subunit protein bL33 n=1 Tax=candidate division WWE3 bacterium TaxID=2053526 RepID=A0A3D0ZQ02_UNCKA|nr:MAG: 50S ribosomal protein L33 [candidate division WWE3 bacterium RIFOXYA2_FULL_43_12]OGC64185.1 MAG: 50S ribosomal protein L33 [candidate division WWE3 bacterium RIFOXYA12_FULL_43_11]OGC73173.1 MAG: 50S ribosomal protein L33 [candidate division WWE3 bacterium RIFOXYB2_FULL_43_9]OGC74087.1 MAG: 50S ribosomal protein L33 [candidate division WWE3 bacterium RIFOXYC2_FULL_42_13]OGC74721.1 MAG: 50S ribosomal protein L33 [candidate division WWE3 bacterium RIFOXYD2_FULL_43_10]HBY10055.1 50S riboso